MLMDFKDKLYYTIGEVKDITGIESHVLRYWESEFPTFNPRKSRTGQRAYTKKDIEMILNIKRLLYEEKFTIKGAKNKLKDKKSKSGTNSLKDLATNSKKDNSQLIFGTIEQSAKAQITDKDFLVNMKKKLSEILKVLNTTPTFD